MQRRRLTIVAGLLAAGLAGLGAGLLLGGGSDETTAQLPAAKVSLVTFSPTPVGTTDVPGLRAARATTPRTTQSTESIITNTTAPVTSTGPVTSTPPPTTEKPKSPVDVIGPDEGGQ